jgi:hypothetical protein
VSHSFSLPHACLHGMSCVVSISLACQPDMSLVRLSGGSIHI